MFLRASVLLVSVLALAACRTTGDEATAVTPDPAAQPGELRAKCEPGATMEGMEPCGTKGRVSLVFASQLATRGPKVAPNVPCTLDKPTMPPGTVGSAIATCFKDDALYVVAECMMCRVPGAGWRAVALVDELSDDQARVLQSRMGIVSDTPLHGTKAWRNAVSATDKHASL